MSKVDLSGGQAKKPTHRWSFIAMVYPVSDFNTFFFSIKKRVGWEAPLLAGWLRVMYTFFY